MTSPTGPDSPSLPLEPAHFENAERCRHAALTLLEGLATSWDIPELAQWMAGPYARAAVAKPSSTRFSPLPPARPRSTSAVLRETRWRLLASLADVSRGAVAWVEEAQRTGTVRTDPDLGWVPVRVVVAPLLLRARSLLAADYLLRSADYRGRALVCARCERVCLGATGCEHRPQDDPRTSGYFSSATARTMRARPT